MKCIISFKNKPERVQPIKSRLKKFESRNFLGINENVICSILRNCQLNAMQAKNHLHSKLEKQIFHVSACFNISFKYTVTRLLLIKTFVLSGQIKIQEICNILMYENVQMTLHSAILYISAITFISISKIVRHIFLNFGYIDECVSLWSFAQNLL